MRVLAIESSCDETSVALVEDGRSILANHVSSQIPIHARYGGVVPELASRNHVIEVIPALEACLAQAHLTLDQVDAFAVTSGPGLVGSLLVGVETAKALASSQNRPLVGVNHIEGHLMAPLMDYDGPQALSGTPSYPFVGLIVSGGHTHLYRVDAVGRYKLLGATRDDAAGEAFDKVAKMLGLAYPGGAQIDRAARRGDPARHRFPRALPQRDNFDFSFSGLKTSLKVHIERHGQPEHDSQPFFDLCASFQEAIVDSLVTKLFRVARHEGVSHAVISGGVSANSRLRERALEVATSNNVSLHIPPPALCTDNAAMIAALAYHYLPDGDAGFDAWTLGASPSLPMGQASAVTHP